MKISEMPGKAVEAVGRLTEEVAVGLVEFGAEKLENRKKRMATPEFKASIDATRKLMHQDIEQAGESASMVLVHFFLTTPALITLGLAKGPWDTLKHNMGTKDPKQKHSYIASLLKGPLGGLWKGLGKTGGQSWQTLKSGGAAALRATTLGVRNTIGY